MGKNRIDSRVRELARYLDKAGKRYTPIRIRVTYDYARRLFRRRGKRTLYYSDHRIIVDR